SCGFIDEEYLSIIAICRYKQSSWEKTKPSKLLEYYLNAFELVKTRMEAPYYILKYYNKEKLYSLAWDFGYPLIKNLDNFEQKGHLTADLNILRHGYINMLIPSCIRVGTIAQYEELYSRLKKQDDTKEKVPNDVMLSA